MSRQARAGEVSAVGPGTAGSFEEFFQLTWPALLRMLSPADPGAEDALAEAFARAAVRWQRISRYEDPARWVRTVAVRRIANSRRGRARLLAALPQLAGPPVSPPDRMVERLDVRAALARLPTRRRLALVLFYLADLPVAQISVEMHITPASVRAHLHQGRAALKTVLEGADEY